jgi:geranylgeranyl diphosphate synthase type I
MHVADAQAGLDRALTRFRDDIERFLREIVARFDTDPTARPFFGQIAYHFGWVDEHLQPAHFASGKLLRPALVLWSCALASAASGADPETQARRLDQAMPVAVAIELIHNFSLVHDDIEDRDELRHHRRAVWAVWGEAQAINAGDGVFCLAHLALWQALDRGLPAPALIALAQTLDRTALQLCEGQYLDMSFEASSDITPEMYLTMIARKTAALMRASAEAGAQVGAPGSQSIQQALAAFGEALGTAFQLRDDLLGIWADSDSLGKAAAGDLHRKKMSLPVIVALAQAKPRMRAALRAILAEPGQPTDEQIDVMLAALKSAGARAQCQAILAQWCDNARAALSRVTETAPATPLVVEAADALGALLDFVASSAQA